ncbi:hypothetical protein WJX81_005213 [Elliptochloris bilobata]|uniref:Uncharacterized protein n=1 Tax=Elliptochloris bilobata TaxID=381761 RepID=A0AAW1SIT7_9CHLO
MLLRTDVRLHSPQRDHSLHDVLQGVKAVVFGVPDMGKEWASKVSIDGKKAVAFADKDGSFSRLLGVEIGDAKEGEPKTQRYAALVEDGILLKLMVEKSVADVKVSSAEAMLQLIKDLQSLKEA